MLDYWNLTGRVLGPAACLRVIFFTFFFFCKYHTCRLLLLKIFFLKVSEISSHCRFTVLDYFVFAEVQNESPCLNPIFFHGHFWTGDTLL